MDRISKVPPWDPWNRGDPQNDRRSRVTFCKELLEFVRPFMTRIEMLVAEFIPEARITTPCSFPRNPTGLFNPVVNLINCYDACAPCIGEATRALKLIESGLGGEDVEGRFLPAPIIAARIHARHADEDRRERRENRPRPKFPRIVEDDEGNLMFSMDAGSDVTDHATTTGERSSASVVPRALRQYARHLITWPDMVTYLQKHEIRDVPKNLKRAKAAAPKPVFSARARRPLYRFVSVLRFARTTTARRDAFEDMQPTAWLTENLQPPDYVPTWAKIKLRTEVSPKANLPPSVSQPSPKRR